MVDIGRTWFRSAENIDSRHETQRKSVGGRGMCQLENAPLFGI